MKPMSLFERADALDAKAGKCGCIERSGGHSFCHSCEKLYERSEQLRTLAAKRTKETL